MMDLRKLSFLAMMCLLLTYIPSFAQEKPSLQTLFKESSSSVAKAKANAADNTIVIDLAEWQNEYDETLNIATGKKYKFINGELKWIGGDKPLITISGNSTVEFADGAKIYSTDGRINEGQNGGMKIIRYSDGTTRKIMYK